MRTKDVTMQDEHSKTGDPVVRSLRLVRRWYRGFMARLLPMTFAEWVNSERCWIQITNAPDGTWSVEIGAKHPRQIGKTLGEAMLRAFAVNEYDPEWQWPSNYTEPDDL